MTTLSAPNMVDMLKMCSRPQPDEIEQYQEMTGNEWIIDEVAVDLYRRDGIKYALLDDEQQPIVVFGADLVIPGVWQTWMISSNAAWESYGAPITRSARKVMKVLFEEGGARRIQTMALASRAKACKWYERGLKMNLESIAKGFGVTGKDFACYVRLREQ